VKRLVSDNLPAGEQEVIWNGDNDRGNKVASGIYFYQMKSGSYQASGKIVMMK